MSLSILALICVAMCAKDCFYSSSTALIATRHGWAAGGFDVLGDIATLMSVGIGAVNIVHIGILATGAFEIYGAIAIGSLIGTVLGVRCGGLVSKHLQE